MVEFLQAVFSGLSTGAIYALLGVGFAFLFSIGRYLNFAHGYWAGMSGMVAGAVLTAGAGTIVAVIVAPLVGATIAVIVCLMLRFARSADLLTVALILLAVGLAIEGLCLVLWSTNPVNINSFITWSPISVDGAVLTAIDLIAILAALVLLAIITCFTRFTRTGRTLDAWSENPVAAALAGINVPRVVLVTFAVSGALAGVAGFLYTAINGTDYETGLTLTLDAFGAAALGGLGRPGLAAVGGFGLGLIYTFCESYLNGTDAQLVSLGLVIVIVTVIAPARAGDHSALTGIEGDRVTL